MKISTKIEGPERRHRRKLVSLFTIAGRRTTSIAEYFFFRSTQVQNTLDSMQVFFFICFPIVTHFSIDSWLNARTKHHSSISFRSRILSVRSRFTSLDWGISRRHRFIATMNPALSGPLSHPLDVSAEKWRENREYFIDIVEYR